MDPINRNFIWNDNKLDNFVVHNQPFQPIFWDKICRPESEGGLKH